ncbi:hypothetical protein KIF24_25535 [Micromonospora sp. Llam7]|uniref:dTMP kinase n=1 Tax=Micromonospora tarapacensis TaxID=2835305 RepID=UPI001C82A143|nr:hypothetical protein [Micromonospora tarapacensis]MBX7269056.1 hypothetical protein [Micromonospora tarapacensis]
MNHPDSGYGDLGFRIPMRRHAWPGKLIAVSGIDASGKTTLIRCIAAEARRRSVVVRRFKFPSRKLKDTALFREFDRDRQGSLDRGFVDPFGLTLVLMGDRLLTLHKQVRGHLQAGRMVIIDRYLFTTLVEFLLTPHSAAERRTVWECAGHFPRPDCYLFTDVPVDVAADRLRDRGEAEAESVDLEGMSMRAKLFREFAAMNDGVSVRTDNGLEYSVRAVRERLTTIGALPSRTCDARRVTSAGEQQ